MNGVFPAGAAELFHFYLVILPLPAVEMVILVLAVRAGDNDRPRRPAPCDAVDGRRFARG